MKGEFRVYLPTEIPFNIGQYSIIQIVGPSMYFTQHLSLKGFRKVDRHEKFQRQNDLWHSTKKVMRDGVLMEGQRV